MVLRSDRDDEFIEPYSDDHKTYSVYRSQRQPGKLPWSCSTMDKQLANTVNTQVAGTAITARSGGDLKVMRLAQSCNGEYANFFGATGASQVSLVLAAFNATLSRVNGVFEKDLALHLNLINATTNVIYYNPATDPYSTTLSSWNKSLQTTLTSVIGEANYDIGHLFGASGGGGNAGCIGCVCVDGSKGSGITSPADGIPQGDNFDIDYVVHEMGHQLGANHTFSMTNEGTGVNKEIGSGITIMGYAGITSQDVAPHSIDIFHQASIAQIQANLATKTCPTTFVINNTAPVVSALTNYTIPKSTPFYLTGSASDANGDALTYCWEQNDNASSTQTGASSVASVTKATGPNWISFKPTANPTRVFPQLSTILAGSQVTGPLAGGDAGTNIEALSSVARTLNFRLTVRDNAPFSQVSPYSVGQTSFADVVVTVNGTAGPFAVTAPNTAVSWPVGTTQTVTWSVNSTNLAPINCANVKITLSTDGGQSFPTVLAESTPNDGTEALVMPSTLTTTARIKIEAVGNIFFDISDADFTIGNPPLCGDPTGLTASAISTSSATVSWTAVSGATSYTVGYKLSTATTWTTLPAQATTSANLTGLTQGSVYDWRVLATCAAGNGNYVAATFTTTSLSCQSAYDVSTNGTTAGAALIPFNTDIKGLISPSGDVDYYKFVITTGGTITATLTTLPANYNLRIYNSAGRQVASSANTGTTNETINYTAAAGTYYAWVSAQGSANNASSCYTLKVALGTASKVSDVIAGEIFPSNSPVEGSKKLQLYPNPAQQAITLDLSAFEGRSELLVFNLSGSLVLKRSATQGTVQLDLSSLKSGAYYLRVVNEKGTSTDARFLKL
jgi:hypothetical protein